MRKAREVLRLRLGMGLSQREVAGSCGIAKSTVGEYEKRAKAAGLSWPLVSEMDDTALERALSGGGAADKDGDTGRGMPDAAYLKGELSKKGVTLTLLWTEYRAKNPAGYGYTQFCEHAHRSIRSLGLVMRQEHHAGEKMFVDWAGDKVRVVSQETGEVREASLFVAVLGWSNYTYVEALPDETSANWIRGHVHALEYFGGVPEICVPDNTKTAVQGPDRYEPDINPLYADMAEHYGLAVMPARVRRPRDKAKVEAGVLVVERWVLAALRNRRFFSLAEVAAAVGELRERLNGRETRALGTSRRQLFEGVERAALRPLPADRYEWVEWRRATVGPDYHVEVGRHHYSVPFTLARAKVDVRLSATALEVLYKHERVASHVRSAAAGGHTTVAEHMPSSHRRHAEWTPARIVAWAAETGPATAAVAEEVLRRRPHPEQGFRSCMGLIALGRQYTGARLESACRRAVAIGSPSYRTVKSLLRAGLDRAAAIPLPLPPPEPEHGNVRGPAYFEEVR